MTAPSIERRNLHALGAWSFALFCATLIAIAASNFFARPAAAYDPWWVATHMDTQLWSGSDARAIAFGPVPIGSAFIVIEPQQGPRLHVQDPRTGGLAFIDAAAVGPIPPQQAAPAPANPPAPVAPPASDGGSKRTPPATPPGFQPFWIANWTETEFWSGPETGSPSLGKVPQFRKFLVVEPQNGERLRVWSPETNATGYMDQSSVGPVGPSVWMQSHPLRITGKVGVPGRAVGQAAYVRNLPVVADETELRHLPNNTAVAILEKGVATDGTEWYTVGEGQYLRASEVRLPSAPQGIHQGRWIDADINGPAMITAYEGDRVVYSALAITGREATPTLRGEFRILRRVEKETMNSETLGVPRDSEEGYFLEDVLYTQYFTNQGAAIHYNWWLGTFGQPGSHGCLGLNLSDSKWFWDWANVGTPVVVR